MEKTIRNGSTLKKPWDNDDQHLDFVCLKDIFLQISWTNEIHRHGKTHHFGTIIVFFSRASQANPSKYSKSLESQVPYF